MREEIKVYVVKYHDRDNLVMRYRDPMTGRVVSRSTGATKRKEAEKIGAKWEAELREGRYYSPSKVLWADFRERYEAEALVALAPATQAKVNGILDRVEEVLNPVKLAEITAARLSYYGTAVRKAGMSDVTLGAHYRHFLAALGWACRQGMLVAVPTVEFPKRVKGGKLMKGRPITGEEFERMLANVAKGLMLRGEQTKPKAKGTPAAEVGEVNKPTRRKPGPQPQPPGPETVSAWQHYLTGLWLSGLRLAESLELFWDGDGRDDRLSVDLTGEYPMLRIPAACEKGNQDRLLPMAPEFAEFLLVVPKDQRTGRVFNPQTAQGAKGQRMCDRAVSGIVGRIGKAAGVKVNTDPKTGRVKFASAHDLRRSFGARWATRVMPPVLMELMRHESIETTLRYYVGRNAQSTAKTLWAAYKRAQEGTILGNTQPAEAQNPGGF